MEGIFLEFPDYIHEKTGPVFCVEIDHSLDSFSNRYGDIYSRIKGFSQRMGERPAIRIVSLKDIKTMTDEEYCNMCLRGSEEMGKVFTHPNFFKDFSIDTGNNFKENYPEFPNSTKFRITDFNTHPPWFKWIRNLTFRSIRFTNGMMIDYPYSILYFYHASAYDAAIESRKKLDTHNFPDFFGIGDQGDSKRSNKPLVIVLILLYKDDLPLIDNNIGLFNIYLPLKESDFFCDFPGLFDQAYDQSFKQHENYIKTIISPEIQQKKGFFSSKPQITDIVQLASMNFNKKKYEESQRFFTQALTEYPTKEISQYTRLMNSLCVFMTTNNNNDLILEMNQFLTLPQNSTLSLQMIVFRIIIVCSVIEYSSCHLNDLKSVWTKVFTLLKTIKHRFRSFYFMFSALCREEMAVSQNRCDNKKKFVLEILKAGVKYEKCPFYGHAIRCFCFVQATVCHSAKKNSNEFVIGKIYDDEVKQSPLYWQTIGNFAVFRLIGLLEATDQFKAALILNIMLLAAPPNNLVSDLHLFQKLHHYFNTSKISSLSLKYIPLLMLDPSHVRISKYGEYGFSGLKESSFHHLQEVMRKKYRAVRGNNAILSMWGHKEQLGAIPVVCGEKIQITFPFRNCRAGSVLIENLHIGSTDDQTILEKVEHQFNNGIECYSGKITDASITIIVKNPGPISLNSIHFRYWAILDDVLCFDTIRFLADNTLPSLMVEFLSLPTHVKSGECCSLYCKIKNFGNVPIKTINAIYDCPRMLIFENAPISITPIKIVEIVNEQNQLNPGEERLIKCYIMAKTIGTVDMRFLFNYKADEASAFRFLPIQETIIVEEEEIFSSRIISHPCDVDKKLLVMEITTKDQPATLSDVVIPKFTYNLKQNVSQPNSSYTYISTLEPSSTTIEDSWRNHTVDSTKEQGFALVSINGRHLTSQFPIAQFPKPALPFMYKVIAPAQASFNSNTQIIINVDILVKNTSQAPSESFSIKPNNYVSISTTGNSKSSPTSQNIFWISNIKRRCQSIPPGGSKTINFSLCICYPGVYDIGRFCIKTPSKKEFLDLTHILFAK